MSKVTSIYESCTDVVHGHVYAKMYMCAIMCASRDVCNRLHTHDRVVHQWPMGCVQSYYPKHENVLVCRDVTLNGVHYSHVYMKSNTVTLRCIERSAV